MAQNKGTVDVPIEEEDEISALLTASIESNSKSTEISPEDAAWVDSCLISNPQMSDNSWDALREALLETLTAQVMSDDEEPSRAQLTSEENEKEETNEYAQTKMIAAEPTIFTGVDNGKNNGENFLGSQEDIESWDNIFKVWELEAQEGDEENELVKQLKKALMESKFQGPSQSDKVLELDELVAGLGDLSLGLPLE